MLTVIDVVAADVGVLELVAVVDVGDVGVAVGGAIRAARERGLSRQAAVAASLEVARLDDRLDCCLLLLLLLLLLILMMIWMSVVMVLRRQGGRTAAVGRRLVAGAEHLVGRVRVVSAQLFLRQLIVVVVVVVVVIVVLEHVDSLMIAARAVGERRRPIADCSRGCATGQLATAICCCLIVGRRHFACLDESLLLLLLAILDVMCCWWLDVLLMIGRHLHARHLIFGDRGRGRRGVAGIGIGIAQWQCGPRSNVGRHVAGMVVVVKRMKVKGLVAVVRFVGCVVGCHVAVRGGRGGGGQQVMI